MQACPFWFDNARTAAELEKAGDYLAEQVVTEVSHELSCAAACHILVAEELKGLLQRLMEQAAVGKAVVHIQHVLVVQLNDLPHKVLFPRAACRQEGTYAQGLNIAGRKLAIVKQIRTAGMASHNQTALET